MVASPALLGWAACAGRDTAVVIEITDGHAHDRLSFTVGSADRQGRFVRDPSASVTVDVRGRDLARDPYRLYLTDERDASAALVAAVVAYDAADGPPVAAAVSAPFSFRADDVLLHRLTLVTPPAVTVGATGCLVAGAITVLSDDDLDCDLARAGDDCDDTNPARHPGASEVCANGLDDDCDDATDEPEDHDGDGTDSCHDCDDGDAAAHPGAAEVCDGVDNDCDGACDEGFDGDGDGVTRCGTRAIAPIGGGRCARSDVDCLDSDPTVFPGAPETCDGRDSNCDGSCDEDPALDADGDGLTLCGTVGGDRAGAVTRVCSKPLASLVDCDPADPEVHAGAHESCDGKDDDCNFARLATTPCFDTRGTGCGLGSRLCDDDDRDGDWGPGAVCNTGLGGVPVAAALCATFRGETCAGDLDPFRCTASAAADVRYQCRLAYRRLPGTADTAATSEICPGARTALPSLGTGPGCQFTIFGGVEQEQVRAGVSATGTGAAASIASCGGFLTVVAARSNLIVGPDELVVLFTENARTVAAVVDLRVTPLRVEACPPSPLECTMR